MMKKLLKKSLAIILMLSLCLSMTAVTASAEGVVQEPPEPAENAQDSGISLYWSQLVSVKPYISVSNGTASISGIATASANITSLKITATIQKKGLLFWSDVKTFTKTFYTYYGTLSDSYYVGSGTYRLSVTVTAYQNGVAKETVTVTS